MVFLHGRLKVDVREAKVNPYPYGAFSRRLLTALNHLMCEGATSVAPYVTLKLTCIEGGSPDVHVGSTAPVVVESCGDSPEEHVTWNQPFDIPVAHEARDLSIVVKDKANASVVLGRIQMSIEDLCSDERRAVHHPHATEGWLPLYKGALHDEAEETGFKAAHERTPVGSIRVAVSFVSVEEDRQDWLKTKDYWELSRSFFPARGGCRVQLYQDAFVPDGTLSDIQLDDEFRDGSRLEEISLAEGPASGSRVKSSNPDGRMRRFQPRGASRDIFDAIRSSKRLIFILGWSMDINLKEVDEGTEKGKQEGISLGELLKQKAEEGVEVRVMLWSLTPRWMKRLLRAKTAVAGLNQEALAFFRRSQVQCALVPRKNSDPKLTLKKRIFSRYAFTHHSKFVLADVPIGPVGRNLASSRSGGSSEGALQHKLVCFLGGMDLSTEDHDTARHTHFDAHGKKFDLWHDVHCCVEGPVAWDILDSFQGQWRKQAVPQFGGGLCGRPGNVSGRTDDFKFPPLAEQHHLKSGKEDMGVELQEREAPVGSFRVDVPMDWREDAAQEEEGRGKAEIKPTDGSGDVEEWHVQVVRSMDAESTDIFPESMVDAFERGLACEGGLAVDRGVHESYVHAIRRAEKFIYVENQFFDGASFAWDTHRKAKAHNLVPLEIALRIAEKIGADEPFRAYIVIPLQPQLTKQARKAVRHWQWLTIKMMYRIVLDAIRRKGTLTERHPQDYLGVYCLGNREPSNMDSEKGVVPQLSMACRCTSERPDKSRLFLVHSKMLLIDDEYINVGSANANDRSLDGSRDTEIAMAAWQPHHCWPRLSSAEETSPKTSSPDNNDPNLREGRGKTVNLEPAPRGDVYGFRMALWEEHFDRLEPEFKEPWRLECMRRVNALAEARWNEYMAKGKGVKMNGHLMTFPMLVGTDGVTKERVRYVPHAWGERLAGGHTYLPHVATV